MMILLVFLMTALPARAHRIGDQDWCMKTMTSHLECFYDNSDSCEDARKIMKEFAAKRTDTGPVTKPIRTITQEGTPINPVCVKNARSVPMFQPDPLGVIKFRGSGI